MSISVIDDSFEAFVQRLIIFRATSAEITEIYEMVLHVSHDTVNFCRDIDLENCAKQLSKVKTIEFKIFDVFFRQLNGMSEDYIYKVQMQSALNDIVIGLLVGHTHQYAQQESHGLSSDLSI